MTVSTGLFLLFLIYASTILSISRAITNKKVIIIPCMKPEE